MPKEFPVGTIREWEAGPVIKAHDPMPPYSGGWIPLVTNAELESIGKDCDRRASSILTHKEPINGERFLDHEIDVYEDENGERPYRADSFKQYMGFEGAGRYAFRNEFSRRFMADRMEMEEKVNEALTEENEERGGDKHHDVLTAEERKDIRKRVRARFKGNPNKFNMNDARKLRDIVFATMDKIEAGENITDPAKKAIYDQEKAIIDALPTYYERIKEKQATKNESVETIKREFADNWGICDSFEHHANQKFAEYVREWKDRIRDDSVEDLKQTLGVDLDMPTEQFYNTIIDRYQHMSDTERKEADEVFKFLVYVRFATKFNKQVEGDWSIDHLSALYNLEMAINELPEGHFLTNNEILLITSKNYSGGDHDAYAWYDPGDSRINFSASCINYGSVFGQLSNPLEFKSTLFHELGHGVSYKFGGDAKYNYRKFAVECGWTYQSKELRAGMTATGSQRSLPRTGSNSHLNLITEYATKSPEEAFAEYYSFYALNKEAIDAYIKTGEKHHIQSSSRWTAKEEDETRSLRKIMRGSLMLDVDDDAVKQFKFGLDHLSERGRAVDFTLNSAWDCELTSEQKGKFDPTYIKMYKDSDQQQIAFAYKDGPKRVVFHGGNDVYIARMNKKMVSTVEIPKEMYVKMREHGYSELELTNLLTTIHGNETPKKQIEPPQLKRGMMYCSDFIDSEQLATNVDIFVAMQKIFHSEELRKALQETFGITESPAHLYIKGEISDAEFQKSQTDQVVEPVKIGFETWLS